MDTQEPDKGDKAHHITTTVYKDLQVNFTQGLKAIWSSGKALHKSLEVTSQKAKAHYDAITILGQAASQSEGTVIAIGHALMQMAEIYKEIQNQADENIAVLKKELCNPFEFISLDKSEKMEDKLKKYNKEHSKLAVPYKKAVTNLHKHRKKGKGGIQNPKEMQYFREATECKQRLDRYRLKHLKDALFEEKTSYLFAFEQLVMVAQNQSTLSRKTQELLEHRISDWEQLTQSKDMSKDALKIIESITDQADNNNGNIQNGDAEFSTDSLSSNSDSLPRSKNDPLPPVPFASSEKPKVRAMYSHDGEGDNQLAFIEDDIILLHGDKRDGWHYGQNSRTKEFGWFPISFTETLRRKNSLNHGSSLGTSNMSKLSRSVADLTGSDSHNQNYHRSQFQFNNFSNDERSTMTLPHKKNKLASGVTPSGVGGDHPPSYISLNQVDEPSSPPLPPPPADLNPGVTLRSGGPAPGSQSFTLPHSFRKADRRSVAPMSPPPPPPPGGNQMKTQGNASLKILPPPPPSQQPIQLHQPPVSSKAKNGGTPPPPPPPPLSTMPITIIPVAPPPPPQMGGIPPAPPPPPIGGGPPPPPPLPPGGRR